MSPTRTEQFDTPEPIRLRVGLAAGRVELTASPVAVTTVELTAEDARAADRLDDVRIERNGNEFAINVLESLFGLGRRRGRFAVRVSLPEGSAVHANLVAADLRTLGRLDTVHAETASGDVQLDDVTGDVKVSTASGQVAVQRLGGGVVRSGSGHIALHDTGGEVNVHTASGGIMIGRAHGSVRARTASGDIAIKAAERGVLEINSASGDVTVGVAQGVGVWLDISTMSGDTHSDLAIGDSAPAAGYGLQLTARTMSGNVQIHRASTPTSA